MIWHSVTRNTLTLYRRGVCIPSYIQSLFIHDILNNISLRFSTDSEAFAKLVIDICWWILNTDMTILRLQIVFTTCYNDVVNAVKRLFMDLSKKVIVHGQGHDHVNKHGTTPPIVRSFALNTSKSYWLWLTPLVIKMRRYSHDNELSLY